MAPRSAFVYVSSDVVSVTSGMYISRSSFAAWLCYVLLNLVVHFGLATVLPGHQEYFSALPLLVFTVHMWVAAGWKGLRRGVTFAGLHLLFVFSSAFIRATLSALQEQARTIVLLRWLGPAMVTVPVQVRATNLASLL